MNDLDPRDGWTWAYGPEPMLIEDRGMVDHIGANGKPLRYRIGVLKPMPKDSSTPARTGCWTT